MKILFLNCNNRVFNKKEKDYLMQNDWDMLILAESYYVRDIPNFPFIFSENYKYGLKVFSKFEFAAEEISYVLDDERIGIKNDLHRFRLLRVVLKNNIKIVAVHIDYGWYNALAMRTVEKHINENDTDIIIGDFNSGYIDDNIDLHTGGYIFQNGFVYFSEYERLGFVDSLKGSKEYTHINNRSKRRFRIDHCFVKNLKFSVKHVDTLSNGISDHKGVELFVHDM